MQENKGGAYLQCLAVQCRITVNVFQFTFGITKGHTHMSDIHMDGRKRCYLGLKSRLQALNNTKQRQQPNKTVSSARSVTQQPLQHGRTNNT